MAAAGIRLVIEELRTDVTKTKKDGTRGRLRIDYGDSRHPEAALKWLWRYVEDASSAGELYGRALVVIAAEQYAARMVLPASQRGYRTHWGSHRDLAAKALRKLAGPHVPASLKALQRAIGAVNKQAEQAPGEHRSGNSEPPPEDEHVGVQQVDDERVVDEEDERAGEELAEQDAEA